MNPRPIRDKVRDKVIVDCAGARMGGALRLLGELDDYLARRPSPGVRVVGRGHQLSPAWLARRERIGRHQRAIALNNVSFVVTRGERWALLRSALHFLSADEERQFHFPRRFAHSIPVVRACAQRADVLVVPSTEMADRVTSIYPHLSSRIVVRMHPLSPPSPRPPEARDRCQILCPVFFSSSYKPMGHLLRLVDQAASAISTDLAESIEIIITASKREAEAEDLLGSKHLRFVGRLTPQQLAHFQHGCRAIIYPTRTESFGYPLAEARLARVPVIALDSQRAREVAGPALVPYQRDDSTLIAEAMHDALRTVPSGERHNPFDPDDYFDWLLNKTDIG
ncbi:glycosyltransferase [Pseudofrankia sp. BMG5.37]|nr:glycosyltransferase [Pseudofrankia sp. BMG5.37]